MLSRIFELADHWKAVLLLDEADVYLRERSHDRLHNSLVSVFLRKLEYYQGIMFLTTNRVKDFNEIIQSKIHLILKYEPLGVDTRKAIWKSLLKMAKTIKGDAIYSPGPLHKLGRPQERNPEGKPAVERLYKWRVGPIGMIRHD